MSISSRDVLFVSALMVTNILTFTSVKSIYGSINRDSNVNLIMAQRKLTECSLAFGTYIATKGKYGLEYYIERTQVSK